MTSKVELGAPSITGKDANDLVAVEFAKAKYPLKVVVTNHAPRSVVFPEVPGLFLMHCANPAGKVVTVDIASADQLQRLASSVEQIAELNGYAVFLTIEEVALAPAVALTPAVKGKVKAPAAVAEQGDLQ